MLNRVPGIARDPATRFSQVFAGQPAKKRKITVQ
jgi:hypothetical protein